jgi:hypothetical protein
VTTSEYLLLIVFAFLHQVSVCRESMHLSLCLNKNLADSRFFQLFFGLTIILSLVITNTTAGFVRRSQDVHAHSAPLHPSGSYMHPALPQTPGVVHYTATPGIGYGAEDYGQQQQLGWSTSNNSMWNGGQQSINYPGNPNKRHRARSRSPEKLRHGSR